MSTFLVTNPTSGRDLGTFEAATAEEALDLSAQDAGYADYAACCEATGQDMLVAVEVA